MAPHVKQSCKEMRRLVFEVDLRLTPSMLSKETSQDPNVAVILEKQLSSLWRCKPDKYYTALPKLNMQTFTPVFRSENSKKCETKFLAVLRFEIAFEIDAFRFNLFSTLREIKGLSSRLA